MRPNEHKKTVILADLGTIRIFRVNPTGDPLTPHHGPTQIEEITLSEDRVNTDRPGRFPMGRDSSEHLGMNPGENHNEKKELEKRGIQLIAEKIEQALDSAQSKAWCLAAPASINKRIIDKLDSETRSFLMKNIDSDLTHITKRELEKRFL